MKETALVILIQYLRMRGYRIGSYRKQIDIVLVYLASAL